ncbi:hypothetical protein ACS0TY_017510 [Phlomoides rotata]
MDEANQSEARGCGNLIQHIRRSIFSEGGFLQVCHVKILEKGDTYEIIERSLPKKPKVKKDPSVIEREEMEKISKYWVNIARKEIPKHHKIFTNYHKKQITDAKRVLETCQREVKMKVSRSLKLMRGAAIRTRKLARDISLPRRPLFSVHNSGEIGEVDDAHSLFGTVDTMIYNHCGRDKRERRRGFELCLRNFFRLAFVLLLYVERIVKQLAMAAKSKIISSRHSGCLTKLLDDEKVSAYEFLKVAVLFIVRGVWLINTRQSQYVLMNILSTRGLLEQGACLDTLIAIMLDTSSNQIDFEACNGIEEVVVLIRDKQVEENLRLKCGEFLLLLIGHVNGWETPPMMMINEDVMRFLGEKYASLIWAACQFGSTLDPEQRLTTLHIQARIEPMD